MVLKTGIKEDVLIYLFRAVDPWNKSNEFQTSQQCNGIFLKILHFKSDHSDSVFQGEFKEVIFL